MGREILPMFGNGMIALDIHFTHSHSTIKLTVSTRKSRIMFQYMSMGTT